MALISLAIYDTPENGRSELTRRTLESLLDTVDFTRHRVFLSVNASTPETEDAIKAFSKNAVRLVSKTEKTARGNDTVETVKNPVCIIRNAGNIGTARAINQAWKHRQPDECAIKMDNDVVIHRSGWVDEMEEAIARMPQIGIIGLKRKDLLESPTNPDPQFRSTLMEVPHQRGQKNLYIEVVQHVMGTCQMYSPALLARIGYLYQPGLYGFDDALSAIRCKVAGFLNVFLCGVEIDHIDPGGTEHTEWKRVKAGEDSPEYNRLKQGYLSGTIPVYYDADGRQTMEPALPARAWLTHSLSTR